MSPYVKYSGMAFQFIAWIAVGYFLGKWVAGWLGIGEQTGIAVGILIFLAGGLFSTIRNILRESDKS